MANMITDERLLIAKPFLKYPGGKGQLLPELEKHVPEKMGRYYEPFMGGAALFFHLSGKRRAGDNPLWATLNDANEDLVCTFKVVQENPELLISILSKYAGRYKVEGEKLFYEVRDYDTRGMLHAERAARFIFLNRTCYNGMVRYNRSGGFNVPHGKYKNPTICDPLTLMSASDALRGANIFQGDFEKLVALAKRGDFVYFDPPYIPAGGEADFTSYTPGGFKVEEHERLRDVALTLKERGVSVLLSNADVPLARKLYSKGFERRTVQARRNVNSNTKRRGPVGELLIW